MSKNVMDFSPLGGDWYLKDRIGKGSYGEVFRAEKTAYGNKYECAIKHISLPLNDISDDELISEGFATNIQTVKEYYESLMKKFVQEINLCYELKGNTNIVSYEDHYIFKKTDQNGYDIFIRMELLTGLNKYKSGRVWSENEVIKLGIDICSALELLNSKGILHRDIKPANIFVNNDGVFKLGDFGESKILSEMSASMSIRGTFSYMSPEISMGNHADIRSDIYSLGLVMYRLLNNNRGPFINTYAPTISSDDNENSNKRRFRGDKFNPPCNCSNDKLKYTILRACEFEPEKRWQTPQDFKSFLLSISSDSVNIPDAAYSSINNNTYNDNATISAYQANNNYNNSPNQINGYNSMPLENVVEYTAPVQPENSGKINRNNKLVGIIVSLSVMLMVLAGTLVWVLFNNHQNDDFIETDTSTVSQASRSQKNQSESSQKKEYSEINEKQSSSEPSKIQQSVHTESSHEESKVVVSQKPEVSKKETVKIKSYLNQSDETAEQELIGSGLMVEKEYDYSFDIDNGNVISQSVSAGTQVEKNTVVKLVISLGPKFDNLPFECRQLIYVVSSGSSANMMLYEYYEGEWHKTFTCSAAVGESGVGYSYGEGKKITPKGTFPIGVVLSKNRLSYNMDWQPCTTSTVIVEDPNSPYYNQIVDKSLLPKGTDTDPIGNRLVNGTQNASIFIEHNGNGYSQSGVTYGAGSSITICGCNNAIQPTWGCIDISSTDMYTLLSNLNQNYFPYIKIE